MKKGLLNKILMSAAIFALGVAAASTAGTSAPVNDADIAKKLVHEIRMYDRYTIWDNINVSVVEGNVELNGQVVQPFKKNDLGRIAKSVPGVASVTNNVVVLPLSPMDDQLRFRVARAVYSDPALNRYAAGALPSIHVIVDGGKVTLEGVVSTQMDKQIAGMRASTAGLSFGPVVNNLRVENPTPKKG
jgi:hyperosmotically inducible protein